MGFNLKVLLHVGGILLTVLLLSWCLLNTAYYATMLTLALILVLQINGLLRHVGTTNRELARFLSAVKYADFSQSFRGRQLQGGFRELGEAFDGVIDKFRRERSDKESQALYLQAFVEQLPVAVFALHDDGRISSANQAFQRFVGRQDCHHLDRLRESDAALAGFLDQLKPGREQSLKLRKGPLVQELKISCTLLRTRGTQQKLVTLQDISSELESRELEAWHNLIRVMTHEIMNSITPITSLADTAHQYITEASEQLHGHSGSTPPAPEGDCAGHDLATHDKARNDKALHPNADEDTPRDQANAVDNTEVLALLDDAANAAATIGKRGQGLLRFVQSYRTLSRLPAPKPRPFRVRDLLQGVVTLMSEQAAVQHCTLQCSCRPETLELNADPELLEQGLLNLVKNALDAVDGVAQAQVTLRAELQDRGQIALTVNDNGCGIDAGNLEQVFVPFFTTKRGGSGIGMTIVRQIVTLNGGTIRLNSRVGAGTTASLVFDPQG